jgi:hypothetical protein
MKNMRYGFLFIPSLIILALVGCTQYPVLMEPDVDKFNQTVHTLALKDSLLTGKLTAGMPYFVVNQVFQNYSDGMKEIRIPVATPGSKQRLEEEEGWSRRFVDPDIKTFLDKYETSEGELYIWYQRPDFYSMEVSSRDTLCIFYDDTVVCSVINYLNKSYVLTVRDSLPQIPASTSLYAEVRYNDHPWREVSYWYNIQILSNAKTFRIGELNYELYPVELLEFDNEPVTSFKWREVNKDEN